MKNVSTILPNTTHVYLDMATGRHGIEQTKINWLKANGAGRVDIFAYESDDPLDHFCMMSIIDGEMIPSLFADHSAIAFWGQAVFDNDQTPRILFAFEDHAAALLFKLTFGGAA